MGILTDSKILESIKEGSITIKPFRSECLGSNSYDVHLSKNISKYKNRMLDSKMDNELVHEEIGDDGYFLFPNVLYLGVTEEYTETRDFIPFLDGKSSTGRLGIMIHATAGKGDIGFKGHWTLEITVSMPVKVYRGMPIGQLIYFSPLGKVKVPYGEKKSAKYYNQGEKPVGSMMFKNDFFVKMRERDTEKEKEKLEREKDLERE